MVKSGRTEVVSVQSESALKLKWVAAVEAR